MEARGRAPPPAAPEADGRLHAADHRRVGLRAAEQDRRRASVRADLAALRAGRHAHHLNLPFDEWTETFGSERLTEALLDPSHPSRQHPREERRQLPRLSQSRARRKTLTPHLRIPISRQAQPTSPGGSLLPRPLAESSTGVDTQLHTYCAVANMVQSSDGNGRTVVDDGLSQHEKFIGATLLRRT